MNDPHYLILIDRPNSNHFFEFKGIHCYESPDPSINSQHPMSCLGLASALHGDFRMLHHVQSLEGLDKYQVIVVVPSGVKDTLRFADWVIRAKRRYPSITFLNHYDGSLISHKTACRNWDFQKAFYELSRVCDAMACWHLRQKEYYALFGNENVLFLPYAYPFHFTQKKCFGRTRSQKSRLLRQAGYMFGRMGSEGYAHVVPLIRAREKHPEFKIQILNSPANMHEVMMIFDTSLVDSRSSQKFLKKISHYVSKTSARIEKRLHPKTSQNLAMAPLELRGVSSENIISKPLGTWIQNMEDWSNAYLAVDMDSSYTLGRVVSDAVAAGTPIIGCNSAFQEILFPELSVDSTEYKKAEELVLRLIEKPEFFDELMEKAKKRLEAYDYDNVRKRYHDTISGFRHSKV